jgi:type VI secretion system secreted protein Hcp
MPTPCSLRVAEYPGSSEKEGREDTIDVFEAEHFTTLPVRGEDGRANGIRRHHPLKVVAEIDKATPGLMKACCTGQNLQSVALEFYRIDPATRSEQKYFVVTMRNARVVKAGPFFPLTFLEQNQNYRHMAQYEFIAEHIEWKWLPDSVVEQDGWRTGGS